MSRNMHSIRVIKRLSSATCDARSLDGPIGELAPASSRSALCGLVAVTGALLPERGYASSSPFWLAFPSSHLNLARSPMGLGGSCLARTAQGQFLPSSAAASFHPCIPSSVTPARELNGGAAAGGAPRAAEGLGDTARVVGGEQPGIASPGNRAVAQQLHPQPQPQKQQEEGWDWEEELVPVPLDPNVETPGAMFITAGAAISAIVAVLIAGLGILGTFYAGLVINQITKELQAAGAGSKPPATTNATTNGTPTTPSSTQEHQVTTTPRVGLAGAKPLDVSTSPSDTAGHLRTPKAVLGSQPTAAKTSSNSPNTSPPAVALTRSLGPRPERATWLSWLGSGLGWWKRRPNPRESPTEPEQLPAGPG
ncbi:hypothetical protein VaNZ11_003203 [Volvox africanus]|uniref:Uncharacterized protein n=1 Tax=Volvox africanus TaxID=51714 RepID=A0ABQ5RVA2_9CHLO|nr:hypothetical protein VaNZ11_003203 [Volvox africanus]